MADQESVLVPSSRPTNVIVAGGAAVPVTIPATANIMEIDGGEAITYFNWDVTATALIKHGQVAIGGIRHYPIPKDLRPTTVSVISASDTEVFFY